MVLVHGDWADGSSWSGVIERLERRGRTVVAPPNPLRGPTSDAADLASFLQTIPGPIVLVAHSCGGFVATNAATGNARTAVLAATQRPAALAQFGEPSGPPAWEAIPSWSLIGTADHVITPAQQQAMSGHAGAHISTVEAGHLSLVTRPDAVTHVIETAVGATT